MRVKTATEGPLSVRNLPAADDILNSPKRLNTELNSNVTSNYHSVSLTSNYNSNTNYSRTTSYGRDTSDRCDNSPILRNTADGDVITELADLDTNTADFNVSNETAQDKVQWCISSLDVQKRHLTLLNNAANKRQNNQFFNINNTLATTIRQVRLGTASSICSEESPDDSLLEFEEAEPSCLSTTASSPQEDHPFDVSDVDSSSSDDGNLVVEFQKSRGIVNPNYPGFQHLAHTLTGSDEEYSDDEVDKTGLRSPLVEANNNAVEDTGYKIDSINRLDSVENIQKVFYDKPVLDIENEFYQDSASDSVNQSDEDPEPVSAPANGPIQVDLNIRGEEKATPEDIVGNFSKEIQDELGRVSSEGPKLAEESVLTELEESVGNLQIMKELTPPVTKYNIVDEHLDKLSPSKQMPTHKILNDAEVVKNDDCGLNLNLNLNVPTGDKECELKMLEDAIKSKIEDAFLSNAKENLEPRCLQEQMESVDGKGCARKFDRMDTEGNFKEAGDPKTEKNQRPSSFKINVKEEVTKNHKEEDNAVPRKKERIDVNARKRRDYGQQIGSWITVPKKEFVARNRDNMNRRAMPMSKNKKKNINPEIAGGFDVYNIETAMPKIDLDVIESHLRIAHEEERRRRTDREEIRRRLAMGSEDDYCADRPGRKPSLQSRLQSGMNLQICFMNETLSDDTDSPSSDSECPMTNPKQAKCAVATKVPATRPATLSIGPPLRHGPAEPPVEMDFFTRQARLQTEARMALAQAKEMARMQMEIERQRQKKSPITEMIRHSLEKVGIPFPEEKRRLSRQILTEMNVAQLQVIVNDLHTQIETLNESLVKFLMDRDDLHMEQDSMLVDIEDLTRYLGAKEQVLKEHNLASTKLNNNSTPPSPAPASPLAALNSTVKPHLHRIASLVKK